MCDSVGCDSVNSFLNSLRSCSSSFSCYGWGVGLMWFVHQVVMGCHSIKMVDSQHMLLFLTEFPLYAACQGVNPNLGRSGNKLDVKALIQVGRALACGGL